MGKNKISFTFKPHSGWNEVLAKFNNDELKMFSSSVFDEQLNDFLRVVYHIYPWEYDPEGADSFKNLESNFNPSMDIADAGTFTWNGEPETFKWRISRGDIKENEENPYFIVHIHIEYLGYFDDSLQTKIYDYDFEYRELCYALAKACTKMLKKYGITGFHHSIWSEDFAFNYFLFIKAVALDKLDWLKRKNLGEYDGESSNLEKEIQLILMDM